MTKPLIDFEVEVAQFNDSFCTRRQQHPFPLRRGPSLLLLSFGLRWFAGYWNVAELTGTTIRSRIANDATVVGYAKRVDEQLWLMRQVIARI